MTVQVKDTSAATAPNVLFPALKEAFIASLLIVALGLPLLGLKADNQGPDLVLTKRWDLLGIAVAVMFVGRFVLAFLRGQKAARQGGLPQEKKKSGDNSIARLLNQNAKVLGLLGLLCAILMPFVIPDANARYVIFISTTFMIYIMLGWGLNIVVGLAGLLDLGYVAFYAVGAYSYALIATHFGWSFWICLPLAGLFAAFFGVVLGFPVLRLRGDYLAIVTLGFGEIIRVILINWGPVTGGPNGIGGIPAISFFGIEFSRGEGGFASDFGLEYSSMHKIIFLYFVILGMAVLTNLFTQRMRKLPAGRAWEALREDEIACRSLGINPTNIKLSAFALGAMFGGFAGSFFSVRAGFISPESFTFIESAVILAIVVLGGMGSQMGVVMAAALIVLLPETFRQFAEYRMLAFGVAMVLIMVWRPRGLLAFREPTIRLHPKDHQASVKEAA
ncbi:high-affinity branched-chain amino acid ABC transporter permease LivM [Insolitispirillum peregrinum]|uniref:Amino acid/amide ABC transporter membrane protein 2, HAAT family n=1 Tax=Insolitispirillum peregrinum TaxID=80876 RepID=A0A1N7NT03_9PROT|nr:high-affinity branched-chain amino acid ABC transporter permease LivM [Insolitispirillum peregrinum]SIT01505.1 amino acid/amide ABC transporter membrane protein 2, HAAT family [Insolitispirillum peregrinum]